MLGAGKQETKPNQSVPCCRTVFFNLGHSTQADEWRKMGVMKESTPEELFKSFISGCTGSWGCSGSFSRCGARASHSSGFSGHRAQSPGDAGSIAVVRQGVAHPTHVVGNLPGPGWNLCPCIGPSGKSLKCLLWFFSLTILLILGIPGSSDGKKKFASKAGYPGSTPGSGRSPGERNGNLLQYSCLENSMTDHGVAKSQTRLSYNTCIVFCSLDIFWACGNV